MLPPSPPPEAGAPLPAARQPAAVRRRAARAALRAGAGAGLAREVLLRAASAQGDVS